SKIACGANADDYHWTEKVLETCFDHGTGYMDGLSLHYYTIPSGDWSKKGSATDFTEKDWYQTLSATLFMETLIKRHGAIMDRFDPEKKIGMMIDEWGIWTDVEPGTNPGFLYQQNTMRDALVAGINLNLFNKHCDRVKMANIAQMVNVLQSVILTDGAKMVKTPTWHAFNLYKVHQDAELVDSHLETRYVGMDKFMVPNLTESVSLGKDGKLYMTLTNLSLDEAESIQAVLTETEVKSVKGTILTGGMNAHNTFDAPETVHTVEFTGVTVKGNEIDFTIPPCCVLQLAVEI
ncbi:MAG: alpha-N-arabinofuranosidase, partial [Lachnospiraceae bacterium]|nr:alpha-N-arabinofuranosidase [Lachnospiraceae bacterium]